MSSKYVHPNSYRLAALLAQSSEMLEQMAKLLSDPKFRAFADSDPLARAIAEQAAHNRRAIAEEWPSQAPKMKEMQ